MFSDAFFSSTKLALGFATRDPSQTNSIFLWSSLDVVLCLPLHIHDGVENVLKRVLFNLHDVVSEYGDIVLGLQSGKQKFPGFGLTHNWVKRSIFWELPYWKTNLLRHNLDVMHIEKNVFENIFNTVVITQFWVIPQKFVFSQKIKKIKK